MIMPEKEGVETIIKLKRDFPDMKIIAISGSCPAPDAKNSLSDLKRLGVALVFIKPFDYKELLEAIQELLATAAIS